MSKEFLWVEKYRPSTIDECILPSGMKTTFKDMVKGGELQNMIFTGTAGTGKTTVAKALCNELGLDFILINGSEQGNIDTLRGKIRQFASTISFQGGYKVVILDEAEYLNPQSTQPALRGFMEEFSKNCRFILTCNFKNRIIEPLHSRCAVYEFSLNKSTLAKLAGDFHQRMMWILKQESIEFDEKAVADLIIKYSPDWRRVINECQRYSSSGKIDSGVLENVGDASYDKLMLALKNKEFKAMRTWVVNNIDTDSSAIFRGIYDRMSAKVKPNSIPALVLILADYQYKSAFVADHELNVVAAMTEIMGSVEFQ
jgi:DNA polymerase III delta prime subunit